MTDRELALKSVCYRRTVLRIIKEAGAGHTGGSLSCIDVLNVLYNDVLNVSPAAFADPARDRYIHSKGHSVEALYTVLADRGFFPDSHLHTLSRYRSHFVGHPTRKVNGIEHNTGALGHGLPVAAGLALAGARSTRRFRVFALLGDGELTEGSVWEAAMAAAHYRLDNLVVIVDRNGLQITGRTEDVMGLEPLAQRFSAFGLEVRTCDGHDIGALRAAFEEIPFAPGRPSLLLARTVKGKGVSFMEDQAGWHHHVPSDAELRSALQELQRAEAELQVVCA
ncbi:MAG: transketolase [Spirochaetaceae bacterium]|nr:transketolase [Spirochaetaceae bacterium]